MQRNVENVLRPHQAEDLLTPRALAGLSGQSFRYTHTNAGPQYGQDWFHKSSGRERRIRRLTGNRILLLIPQISKEFYGSVPVSCVVVVGIFSPYLGRERSDASRGPGNESCNTTCRTEYSAAERGLRKPFVAAKRPCRAAFSAAEQAFS